MVLEVPQQQVEEFYLWPENVASWELFQRLQTQWVVGPNGPVGLHYPGVESYMRMKRIKRKKQAIFIADIQVMEQATIDAWYEKRSKS